LLPRTLTGTRICGNASYQPPRAPKTFQDLRKKPKTCFSEPDFV